MIINAENPCNPKVNRYKVFDMISWGGFQQTISLFNEPVHRFNCMFIALLNDEHKYTQNSLIVESITDIIVGSLRRKKGTHKLLHREM